MNRNRIKVYISVMIAAVLMIASCNLDSNYGVLQQKFNANASNSIPVESVLGIDDGNIIFVSRGDIYSTDGTKDTKIAEMTSYNTNDLRINPLFTKDGIIFLSCLDKETGLFSFFHSTAEDLNNKKLINTEYIETNNVPVTISGSEGTELTFVGGPFNFNQGVTYVLYNIAGDNEGVANADDMVRHYGFIEWDTASTEGITISGGAPVHIASTIIGDRAVRVYIDDSDLYKNKNYFYFLSEDGSGYDREEYPLHFQTGNYDHLPIGSDGEYVISMEGDIYDIAAQKWKSLVNDLIYRTNNTMPVFTNEEGDKIGYLYEGGIYINPAGADTAADVLVINDDNDLITSAWIGCSGDDYLMATQENGLWIVTVTLGDNGKYTGSIHRYNPENDGAISEYTGH